MGDTVAFCSLGLKVDSKLPIKRLFEMQIARSVSLNHPPVEFTIKIAQSKIFTFIYFLGFIWIFMDLGFIWDFLYLIN